MRMHENVYWYDLLRIITTVETSNSKGLAITFKLLVRDLPSPNTAVAAFCCAHGFEPVLDCLIQILAALEADWNFNRWSDTKFKLPATCTKLCETFLYTYS